MPMTRTLAWISLFAALVWPDTGQAQDVFVAQDGLLVVEVESAPAAGDWTPETDLTGFTGDSYYTWTGPDLFNSPGSGVLSYRFRVDQAGTYNYRLHNRHDFADSTEENDCFTRIDGGAWVKTFSHTRGRWTWATNHEFSHDDKPPAEYVLAAGEHVIELSGRSHGFSIDRFHLYLDAVADPLDTGHPESPREPAGEAPAIDGELKKWHTISLTWDGPAAAEDGDPNPFRDSAMWVRFSQGGHSLLVPGFFAADGDAAETSATSGNRWRVLFSPDREGTWNYRAYFRTGSDVALATDPTAGSPAGFDGASGSFSVGPSDKAAPDFRARGRLEYVGGHHLQFAETGQFFLKGGADSPENFLAYGGFDQTQASHQYAPHAGDAQAGDPTWDNGRGANILGAINYLASKGMNSVYFLTMNVTGDGDDVWPWTARGERFRFDVSKLAQWERVFAHMESRGVMMHVITQETENDQLLDGGALGDERRLYYRELVARFGHHLGLVWNLGEENTNSEAERKAFASFIRELDPYDHPVVVHTYPGQYDAVYNDLLGYADFEGPSLQIGGSGTHAETITWLERSAGAGRPWVVCLDEIGPANTGVKPDADDPTHDAVRQDHLWGNLMAGGAGVEWYFGYNYAHNDLNCEDWRSRDAMWDQTRHALVFFQQHLPFAQMRHRDELLVTGQGYVLARAGQVYAVYLEEGGAAELDLSEVAADVTFELSWYDPRNGGALQAGSIAQATGGGVVALGTAPDNQQSDWVVLVEGDGEPVEGPRVTGVTLIDADADQPIAAFDPMADGALINLAHLATDQLNIRANTAPAQVGSVRFDLDGAVTTENVAPYAMQGDMSGDYNAWTPALGSHQLTATAFSGPDASGLSGDPLLLDFEVVDDPDLPDGGIDGGQDDGGEDDGGQDDGGQDDGGQADGGQADGGGSDGRADGQPAGDDDKELSGGCGCASAGGGSAPVLCLLALLALRRRRAR
jgi:hypothetical protein